MSLKEDLETIDYYHSRGLLKEYLTGKTPIRNLRDDPWPADPSAGSIRGKELGTNNKEDG